jgi:DNA polymerase
MSIYTIDLETYYAKDYSLSKLTTEEYVNDPRFEVIGLAIKKGEEETQWYSGDDVAGFLNKFDFSNSMIVCHNTMFDAAILGWRYGVNPKVWADTMSMARFVRGVHVPASLASLSEHYALGVKGTEVHDALGKRRADFTDWELARYGGYCVNDVDLTYRLFKRLLPKVPAKELRLIDLTLRFFVEPVMQVDSAVLEARLSAIRAEKEEALHSLQKYLCVSTNEEVRESLSSNKKFSDLLRVRGIKVPMKTSPATGKSIPALGKKDSGFIDLQNMDDPFVQLLCSVRLGTKSTMEEGRIENFIAIAQRNKGKLPIPLFYCGAHTSRWGGGDQINLQNLPSRDPKKKALKNSMVAPPGHVVINCDSSQIEARVLAWLADQNDILEAFRNKEDVYRLMGSKIYKKKPEEITKEERFLSKTVVLGCGFGTGAKKLRAELKSAGVEKTEDDCIEIIKVYRESNYKIRAFWYEVHEALKSMNNEKPWGFSNKGCLRFFGTNAIELPSGYKIRYPGLSSVTEADEVKYSYVSRKGKTPLWFGTIVENVVQGLARCVVAEQMLKISKRYRAVLTVHDAVVVVCKAEEREEAVRYIEECMSTAPSWAEGLPVACESGWGLSYGDT